MSAQSQGLYKSVETLWDKHNKLEARVAAFEGKQVKVNRDGDIWSIVEDVFIRGLQHSEAGHNNVDIDTIDAAVSNIELAHNAELQRRIEARTKREQLAMRILDAIPLNYAIAAKFMREASQYVNDEHNPPDLGDFWMDSIARSLETAARDEAQSAKSREMNSELITYGQLMREEIHQAVLRVAEHINADPQWEMFDERMLGIPAALMCVEAALLDAFDKHLNDNNGTAKPAPDRPQFSLYEGQALHDDDRKPDQGAKGEG